MKEPNEYLDLFLTKPIEASINALDNVQKEIEGASGALPNTLQMFPEYLKSLENIRRKVANIGFEVSSETLGTFVSNLMVTELADAQDIFDQKTNECMSKVTELYERINSENEQHNNQLYRECDMENSVFLDLKNKHEALWDTLILLLICVLSMV